MTNPFVHVELTSTDVNKSKEFYGKLFDWKMPDMPNPATGTYTLINVGEGTGGGMMKNPMPGAPSGLRTAVRFRLSGRVRAAGGGVCICHAVAAGAVAAGSSSATKRPSGRAFQNAVS